MNVKATKGNFTPPAAPLPRLSERCHRAMVSIAKWWWILCGGFLIAHLFRLQVYPVDFYTLNVLIALFLAAALGRLACCIGFVVTGTDVRTKGEQYFIPSTVRMGVLQRLYMAARMLQKDSFGTLSACLLSLAFNQMAKMLGGTLFPASQYALLGCCAFTAACLLIRLALLHLHTFGWVVIYEPTDMLYKKQPAPETDESGTRVLLMRVMMLTRQAPTLLAMLAVPVFVSGLTLASLLIIPLLVTWTEIACAGLLAMVFLYALLRFTLVATVFARYSISHVLGMQLALGLSVSLAMTLPTGWSELAFFVSVGMVFTGLFYIVAQDPDGEGYVPEFIKARRREVRRKRWEKEAAAQTSIAAADVPPAPAE